PAPSNSPSSSRPLLPCLLASITTSKTPNGTVNTPSALSPSAKQAPATAHMKNPSHLALSSATTSGYADPDQYLRSAPFRSGRKRADGAEGLADYEAELYGPLASLSADDERLAAPRI